jgi:broad specificity phosphatase PhoE
MKIYFLRHEKRPQEQTFEISLTEEGHQNAQKLIPLLDSLSIQQIYSSPFIRCLETLLPFCKSNGKNINVENSLYEFVTERLFTHSNYNQSLTPFQKSNYLVNQDYTSFFNIENLLFPQTEEFMEERMYAFLNHLINQYQNQEISILLCGHKKIVDKIYTLYLKEQNSSNENMNKFQYPMGGVSLVYENNTYCYQPLNFE